MNEVEKMYENAGIGKQKYFVMQDENYKDVFEIKYPPFTAEKQLELIKWLGKTDFYTFGIFYHDDMWFIFTEIENRCDKDFAECLAKLVNLVWQELTEEERKQIRGILE